MSEKRQGFFEKRAYINSKRAYLFEKRGYINLKRRGFLGLNLIFLWNKDYNENKLDYK